MDCMGNDEKVEHSVDSPLDGVEAKIETMNIHNEEKQNVSEKGEVVAEELHKDGVKGKLVKDEKPQGITDVCEENKPQEGTLLAKSGLSQEAQMITEISRAVGLQDSKEGNANASEKHKPETMSEVSKETISSHGDTGIGKAVGLDNAEEGELDYEEEEIHDPVVQREDQEEGEMLDEKELEAEKEAEGSEEGEILSDDDDDAKVTLIFSWLLCSHPCISFPFRCSLIKRWLRSKGSKFDS